MKKISSLHSLFFLVVISLCLMAVGLPAQAQDDTPVGSGIDSEPPEVIINSADDVTIDVWYGNNQRFGRMGNPQEWVNILGNVSPVDNLQELTYALNGRAEQPLSFEKNRRLVNPGDFNIEMRRSDLRGGTNTITIKATEKDGTNTREKFSFTYAKGNTWPQNYEADWSSSSDIYDIAQVVDGKWAIESNRLITKEVGYERLVAIGDVGSADKGIWTDYEVTVPVTVKSLDESGYGGLSNGPAVGVYLRWQGHTLREDEQPRVGTEDSGALGRYHWIEKDGEEGLEIKGDGWRKPLNTTKKWELNTPYTLKMSVQSVDDSSKAYYRLKFWKQGEMEPAAWDVEGFSDDNNTSSGSMVLVAHHVDAEFGDVQIRRLADLDFTLTTDVTGSGTLDVSPLQNNYEYGDKVTLTAAPADGYYLESWSGDMPAPGTENPLEINMTQDMSITANFTEPLPGTLTVNIEGQGQVTREPDKESYEGGEVVTLTAVPDEGSIFAKWSGDLSGTLNPVEIVVNGDKTVTATFEESEEGSPISDDFSRCELYSDLWTFANPGGLGSVAVDSAAGEVQLTAPAGPTMTMWNTSRDAPRIMQDTENDDFTVEIKFTSVPQAQNHFQGLLVEQDADNWLRFDILYQKGALNLFAAVTTDGSSKSEWKVPLPLEADTLSEIYLRVSRIGDTWTQSYSTDGMNWQKPQVPESFDHPLTVTATGIFVGNENASGGPDFMASADYFRNTAFPSGITGYLLSLDVIGAGDVQLDPQPDENGRYSCTAEGPVEVALQATPEESFIEWSGDATGSDTAVTLTMDGDKSVTATFVEEYSLTTTVIGDGHVAISPDQEAYEAGSEVTLTAVAGQDYYFAGWSGDASGISNPLIVTMDSDKSITAIFAKATVFMPSVMGP